MKTAKPETTSRSKSRNLIRGALALGLLGLASAPGWALTSGEAVSPAATVEAPSQETAVTWNLTPVASLTTRSDGAQGTSSAELGIQLATGTQLAASVTSTSQGAQRIGESSLRLDTSLGTTQLSLQETSSGRREAALTGAVKGLQVNARYTAEAGQRMATLGLSGQLSEQRTWELSHSRGTGSGSSQHATSITLTQTLTNSVSVNAAYNLGSDDSTHSHGYQLGMNFSKAL
jgi:hypothetical protein